MNYREMCMTMKVLKGKFKGKTELKDLKSALETALNCCSFLVQMLQSDADSGYGFYFGAVITWCFTVCLDC